MIWSLQPNVPDLIRIDLAVLRTVKSLSLKKANISTNLPVHSFVSKIESNKISIFKRIDYEQVNDLI